MISMKKVLALIYCERSFKLNMRLLRLSTFTSAAVRIGVKFIYVRIIETFSPKNLGNGCRMWIA
ncbi:hypothetical protein THIOM_002560 [Candidatus Thiomargarita nelsonii]|uniref:Uncharacterized protein n=1 Tax=Candidatus Thiomargarita nelsonii TaxID=1003181 RepID=A0A176S164_9GAMM|nr:hypothetical protein THIOM_002560 [Candidatus Thiomargarita nelsonii]